MLLFLVLWTVTFCESLAIGRLLFRCDCIVSYDWLMMTLERRHDLIMLLINKYWMRLSILWRIMEIEEGVIRRGRRPRRITPSEISIILHMIWKPNSIMCVKWGWQAYTTPQRVFKIFKAITKGGTTHSSQKTHTIFKKNTKLEFTGVTIQFCIISLSLSLSCSSLLLFWICKSLSVII